MPALPALVHGASRSRAPPAQQYTVTDVGSPNAASTNAAACRPASFGKPSYVNGISTAGVGDGEAFNYPPHGTYDKYSPFVLQGKTNHVDYTLLQPTCIVVQATCMYLDSASFSYDKNCGFGGCSINDAKCSSIEFCVSRSPDAFTNLIGTVASAPQRAGDRGSSRGTRKPRVMALPRAGLG